MVNWELHGMEFGNCNCSYGCPCQFNAPPTQGHCEAVGFFRIDRGHFGDVTLSGLHMAIAVKWPGAVHQGGGQMQPILDRRADDAQRQALFGILTGRDTKPMSNFWAIFSAMCATIHPPKFATFTVELDMSSRRARCVAEGMATGRGEPILNPVTGEEHRVGIVMPNGFEFGRNEVGRGWSASQGEVVLNLSDSYAHWCELHFNQDGRLPS